MFYQCENNGGITSYIRYYLPLVEIKDYNVMIDGRTFYDQPVKKNDLITYDNTQKIATDQGDDYTTASLHKCLASLAKWLSVRLRTNWLLVRVLLQSHSCLFTRLSLLQKLL